MTRFPFLLTAAVGLRLAAAYEPPIHFQSPDDYVSPFALEFRLPERARVSGWDRAPWNSVRHWGTDPGFPHWYDPAAYQPGNLAWGPATVQMPAPERLSTLSDDLLVEKLLTAAAQYLGMRYQHHHLPAFDPFDPAHYQPPPAWPWLPVSSGARSRGLDCSNFVSWAYNFALGLKLDGSVTRAAAQTGIPGPGGDGRLQVQTIPNTGQTYAELVTTLEPGDVLYFHGDQSATHITHSALWIGARAKDANGVDRYFVLDSTGAGTLDSAGESIPDGVHLRPFNEKNDQPGNWYFRQFDHAHRIVPLLNARPTLAGPRRLETRASHIRLSGTAASPRGIARVEYRVGRTGRLHVARGRTRWHFQIPLACAHTIVHLRAVGGNGLPSRPRRVHVIRL